jgi:predicted AAA+ superfamily ATPase
MHGLSFREYIKLNNRKDFDVINLKSILKDHVQFSREITGKIKPIQLFNEYLKIGYYPYFIENKDSYHNKLAQTVNLVLEVDLPYAQDISSLSIDKLKKLLYILAVSVPFKPNVLKLSEKTGISRNTIIQFINYLADAKIINLLNSDSSGISQLQKPQKIYLHHPNLLYTLAPENANTGSVRESFFNNQLSNVYKVNYTDKGDFLVNDKYTFEIGGKNKSRKQIADVPDSFIASDDLEIGFRNRIPLWLFGFLY